jgi:hypothetical protein
MFRGAWQAKMSTDNKQPRDVKVVLTPATFMSFDPMYLTADKAQQFIVMSLERDEGKIDQIAFTHHDGQIMLGALLEVLASQGSSVAKQMLDVIQETLETEEEDEQYNQSSEGREISIEEEGGDPLNDSTGDFGPDA